MLLFQPLESAVDSTFWSALSDLKLDTLGLSEEALTCHGASPPARFAARQPCRRGNPQYAIFDLHMHACRVVLSIVACRACGAAQSGPRVSGKRPTAETSEPLLFCLLHGLEDGRVAVASRSWLRC